MYNDGVFLGPRGRVGRAPGGLLFSKGRQNIARVLLKKYWRPIVYCLFEWLEKEPRFVFYLLFQINITNGLSEKGAVFSTVIPYIF